MIKPLEDAISVIQRLSPEEQEHAAALLQLFVADRDGVHTLDPEERAAVRQGLEDARRGDYATDEEMEDLRKPWR